MKGPRHPNVERSVLGYRHNTGPSADNDIMAISDCRPTGKFDGIMSNAGRKHRQ